MRLKGFEIERQTSDKLRVTGMWTNKMREPAKVTVTMDKASEGERGVYRPIIQGDIVDVQRALSGLAEIAWEAGWRPHGLEQTMVGVVRGFKIPKKEG